MSRVRIITNCVADAYANKRSGERIVEFMDDDLQAGGLISFRRTPDGKLSVYLYRLDDKVQVSAAEGNVNRPPVEAGEMIGGVQ